MRLSFQGAKLDVSLVWFRWSLIVTFRVVARQSRVEVVATKIVVVVLALVTVRAKTMVMVMVTVVGVAVLVLL